MRRAQLAYTQAFSNDSQEEECVLNEESVMANVTSPLLSMGRLLKPGWTFSGMLEEDRSHVNEELHGKCAGMLVSPDLACRIPVYFKRNSLSILACVRRIETAVYTCSTGSCGEIQHGCGFFERRLEFHREWEPCSSSESIKEFL